MPFSEILQTAGIPEFGWIPFHKELVLPVKSASRIPAGCRTVIVCLFPYDTGDDEKRNVSRYAVGRDYHAIVKPLLTDAAEKLNEAFPAHTFVPFVDASPITEVRAAAEAGLGVIGQNRLLLTPRYGSYVFIGEILTDLSVPCEAREIRSCENCGACLAACPAKCLTENAPCLSAITQKKGNFSEEEKRLFDLGSLVWGCDVCQEVCPHNKKIEKTPIAAFYEDRRPFVTEENVLENFGERAYAWRGKEVILRNIRLKE